MSDHFLMEKKAAITKDDTNWQLSLSGLMKLGTDEDTGTGMDVEGWYGLQRLYENVVISGR